MKDGGDKPPSVVLVVEDDPLQRMMAVDMVESLGLAAVEATDASMAMLVLERRSDIRVLFTDIDMPRGPDGLWLAGWARERWPGIGLVVISGKRQPDVTELPTGTLFFPKPYIEETVGQALKTLTKALAR